MKQCNDNSVTTQGNTNTEPQKYRKRIGSTVYVVSVNFSNTSNEKVEDKLLRLIKREGISNE